MFTDVKLNETPLNIAAKMPAILKTRLQKREEALKKQESAFEILQYQTFIESLLKEKEERDRIHRGINYRDFDSFYRRFMKRNIRVVTDLDTITKHILFIDEKEIPPYYKQKRLSTKEFEEELDYELKGNLRRLENAFLKTYYHEFARTLDRTQLIKDEFMLVLTRMNCIKACRTIKEELMAAAWHPDRIMKWLSSGRSLGDINGEA